MMGPRQVEQGVLFYNFSLDAHVPADHLLRSIDRFVDLSELRRELAPFYSTLGRPSIDPELMIRMLIIGYCFGIRSERRAMDRSPWRTSILCLFHQLSDRCRQRDHCRCRSDNRDPAGRGPGGKAHDRTFD